MPQQKPQQYRSAKTHLAHAHACAQHTRTCTHAHAHAHRHTRMRTPPPPHPSTHLRIHSCVQYAYTDAPTHTAPSVYTHTHTLIAHISPPMPSHACMRTHTCKVLASHLFCPGSCPALQTPCNTVPGAAQLLHLVSLPITLGRVLWERWRWLVCGDPGVLERVTSELQHACR